MLANKSIYKKVIALSMMFIMIFGTMVIVTVTPIKANAASVYGDRPLVGAIDYEGLKSYGKFCDELSLTPPKWNYRLPFYASVTNDASRLTRTANTQQEIVYKRTTDIRCFATYAAFDSTYTINTANDIKIYTSPNGSTYTQFVPGTWDARVINYATNWQKVSYKCDALPVGTRYLKIAICKTNGTASSVQLMRTELYSYNATATDFVKLADDYNDYSNLYSYTAGLTLATNNTSNFSLVTADDNTQALMDQQISYANSAHLDYLAWVDGPKYNLPSKVDLFRSSTNKGNLKYSVIVHMKGGETWDARSTRYVSYFGESSYVKVLSSRPLLYLFDPSLWTKAEMDILRNKSIAAGYGNPYIVGMSADNYSTFCDAGGSYSGASATAGVTTQYAGTTNTVPLISFGMNDQPRQDNPVPWGNMNASSTEIWGVDLKVHVNNGIKWCVENPTACNANTVLIYAWNEHAEAAANIEPTRNTDGTINTSNLTSVGSAIKSWEGVGSNLLSNSGFESGLTPWIANSSTNVQIAAPHSGTYACLASNRTGAWGSPKQDIKSILLAKGQGSYTYSTWVRYASVTDGTAVMINTVDSNGSHWFASSPVQVGTTYQQLTGLSNITWTGTLTSATIYIQSTSTTSNVYVDDFSVLFEGEGSNLLSNSGFESGLTSWSAQSSSITQTASPHSDTYSCLISNRTNTWSSTKYDIRGILLIKGQGYYTYSTWAKYASVTDGTVVIINIVDGSGSHWFSGSTVQVGSTTYQQLNGVSYITWTGTLSSAAIYIQSSSTTGNIYVDDFSFATGRNP